MSIILPKRGQGVHKFQSTAVAVRVTVGFSLVVLGGCSSLPERDVPAASTEAKAAWVERMGKADAGDVVTLPASSELGVDAVRVGASYTAASGRRCKRLSDADDQVLTRLVCHDAEQQAWYLTRSLSVLLDDVDNPMAATRAASGSADTSDAQRLVVLAADGSARAQEPAVGRAVQARLHPEFALGDGQTLWSFAAQHTGDPMNWEAIAEHNAIDDAIAVKAGTLLEVPSSLALPTE